MKEWDQTRWWAKNYHGPGREGSEMFHTIETSDNRDPKGTITLIPAPGGSGRWNQLSLYVPRLLLGGCNSEPPRVVQVDNIVR
jgi:hypothetical protein